MPKRPSRAQQAGDHTYNLERIPDPIWQRAMAKATREHEEICGPFGTRKCPVHSMRAVLLRLLEHYGRVGGFVDDRL